MANILVVDDELGMRQFLTHLLQREGHVVRVAENGRDALTHIRGEAPDLIISDIRMPDMDGVALLRAARELVPDVEVIMELMLVTAIALLFSSFSSPALSALLTFLIFVIGHFSADLKSLAVSLGSASARWLFTSLYYLLPNLANYSFITPAAHGNAPSAAFVFSTALYALVYITVILAAATLIFSRRNFK